MNRAGPALVEAGWIGARFAGDPALGGPLRPRLIRELVVQPLGSDGLLFAGASETQVVRGRAARSVLPRILPLLDGTRTLAELAAAYPAVPPQAIRDLVLLLYSRGLLEDGESPDDRVRDADAVRDPDLDSYLGRFVDVTRVNRNRAVAWARLDGLRFTVLGDAAAGEPLAAALTAAGLQAGFAAAAGEAALGPDVFVVAAATDPGTDLEPAFAAAARAGAWALHLRVGAVETQLGPLFVPGRSVCYPCARAQHGIPAGVPARARVRFGLGLASSAAVNLAARIAYPPLHGRLARYVAGAEGIRLESCAAPRVPGCPRCGIAGPALGAAEFAVWALHAANGVPPPELADPRSYQEHLRQSNVAAGAEPAEPRYGAAHRPLPYPAWFAAAARPEDGAAPLAGLAELLLVAGGERPGWGGLRLAPSGGNLKSPELYVGVFDLPGLAPGAYRYDPAAHALAAVGPPDERLRRAGPSGAAPAALVVGSGALRKVHAKYGEFAHRLIALDAGIALGYLHLVAQAAGVALREYPELEDALLADALRIPLRANQSVPTFAVGVGPAPEPGAAPTGGPLLAEPQAAIVRRRSTRRFADRPLEADRLAALAGAAQRVLAARRAAGGFAPALHAFFVLRHAAPEREAGVYRYDACSGRLLLERRGFDRADFARCVRQPDLRSAAGLAFLVGDLRAAFAARGARGYRELLLAAGSALGALLVAAEADGIASCAYGGLSEDGIRDLLPALDGFNGCVLFGAALGYADEVDRDPAP